MTGPWIVLAPTHNTTVVIMTDKVDTDMDPPTKRAHKVVRRLLVTHGPCPDGMAAEAIIRLGGIEVHAGFRQSHGMPWTPVINKLREMVGPDHDTELLCVDIAPDDATVAAVLECVNTQMIILDHHVSEHARCLGYARANPLKIAFVYGEGRDCGAVLARKWVELQVPGHLECAGLREDVIGYIAEADTTNAVHPMAWALRTANLEQMTAALTASEDAHAVAMEAARGQCERDQATMLGLITSGIAVGAPPVPVFCTFSASPLFHKFVASFLWYIVPACAPVSLMFTGEEGNASGISIRVPPHLNEKGVTALDIVNIAKGTTFVGLGGGGHADAAAIQFSDATKVEGPMNRERAADLARQISVLVTTRISAPPSV
jgi:hypothetical protein